ncbi:MAG: hypothetical protein U0892_18575 [Pirellulales bacterium]
MSKNRRKKSLRQWFKSVRARSSKNTQQKRRALFESFEERRLLAAEPFNYPSGIIDTLALLGPNEIFIRQEAGKLVVVRGDSTTEIPADATSVKIDAGAGRDVIRLEGNLDFHGVDLTILSEEIYVLPGTSISARDVTFKAQGLEQGISVGSNLPIDVTDVLEGARKIGISSSTIVGRDITLEASRIASLVSSVRPFGVGNKNSEIVLDGATVRGENITIGSIAKDENILNDIPDVAQNWAVAPALGTIGEYLPSVPFTVMVRGSTAKVQVNNSSLEAAVNSLRDDDTGDVKITAEAASDSTTSATGAREAENIKKRGANKVLQEVNRISAGYSQADSSAIAELLGASQIIARGNFELRSDASTIANVTTETELNAEYGKVKKKKNNPQKTPKAPTDPNAVGASIAVTNSNTTSLAKVGSGVVITATGNADIHAVGDASNSAAAGVSIYVDGRGGLGVALNFDKSNVLASVDGHVNAGGSKTTQDLVLSNINSADNTIELRDHGFKTGDELIYLPVDPTDTKQPPTELKPVGGLVSGEKLRVIVLDENHIQLTRESGLNIDASITDPSAVHGFRLRDSAVFNPAASVDLNTNRLTVPKVGIVEGSEVSYSMATSGASGLATKELVPIGGLLDGQNYYAVNVVNNGNGTTSFQLATLDEPTLPIDLSQGAVGDSHMIIFDRSPMQFTPKEAVNDTDNTIVLPSHNLKTGDAIVYNTDDSKSTKKEITRSAFLGSTTAVSLDATGDSVFGGPIVDTDADVIHLDDGYQFYTGQRVQYTAGGNPIGGLADGQFYYAVRVDDGSLGLALTKSAADQGILIDLTAGGTHANHSLRPEIQDGNELVVPQHGFQTGQAITYAAAGAPSFGLTDGATYYAIVTSPDRVQLAASRTNASAGIAIPLNTSLQHNSFEGFSTKVVVSPLDLNRTATLDTATDILTIPDHGLGQGATVVYRDNGVQALGGLAANAKYRVNVLDKDRIQILPLDSSTPINLDIPSGNVVGTHMFEVVVGDVDAAEDVIFLGDHGLSTGDLVRYDARGNTVIGSSSSGFMKSGETYEVVRLNGDEIQLATLDGVVIDLRATDSRVQALTVLIPRIDSSMEVAIDKADLSLNQLTITNHGLQTGDQVRYRSKGDQAIGGLIDGATYSVSRIDADRIQLRTQSGSIIDLAGGASAGALHSLEKIVYSDGTTFEFTPTLADTSTVVSVIFDPAALPVVDLVHSRLRMTSHTFENGEQVTYLTGGGTAIGGLSDGQTYQVIVIDADTIQLAAVGSNLPITFTGRGSGSNQGLERKANVTVRDQAIRGLQNGELVYAIVLDANTIRLSGTRQGALASQPIDLDKSVASGSVHTLKTDVASGIGVRAELSALDWSVVETGLGGPSIMFADLLSPTTAAGMYDKGNRKMLKLVATNKLLDKLRGTGAKTNDTFSVAGSISINTMDHQVHAVVGSNAVLKSGQDAEVIATIDQSVKSLAQAKVSSDNGGESKPTKNVSNAKKPNRKADKQFAGGVGIAVGDVNNEAQAIIDSGAIVDAKSDVRVNSEVSYPLLITPLELLPLVRLENSGLPNLQGDDFLGEISQTISGNLGLTDIVNVWVMTSVGGGGTADGVGGAKFTTTGSLAMMNYDNGSHAIIRNGAQINQDPVYWTDGQSVYVDAETMMELVNVAGSVALNLNIDGIRNAATATKDRVGKAFTILGNKAGTLGVGGSALIQLYDNDTQATIENGARVRNGVSGALEVKATEDVTTFDFVQAGGESGKAGISGSVSILDHQSDTLARVQGATTIVGEDVDVSADSNVSHIALTGAVQLGKSFGVGVTVGVQDLNRRTLAIIGDQSVRFNKSAVSESNGQIELPGHGLKTGDRVVYRPAEGGEALSGLDRGKTYYVIVYDADHIGLSLTNGGAPISLTRGGDQHLFDVVTGKELLVNNTQVSAALQSFASTGHGLQTGDVIVYELMGGTALAGLLSGAAYYVIRVDGDQFKLATSRENALAGVAAGAITAGNLTGTSSYRFTRALSLSAASVNTQAKTSGAIWTFGVAGAAVDNAESTTGTPPPPVVPPLNPPPTTPRETGIAIAGNATVNTIQLITQAYVNSAGRVQLAPSGSISVSAADSSGILAVSGAVALARQTAGPTSQGATAIGLAGAISRNDADFTTEAFVARLDELDRGDVSVSSERTGGVLALSAGMVGTQSSSLAKTKSTKGAALGGSVSYNTIDSATRATIDDAKLTRSGSVDVKAFDKADLHAIGGGLGISIAGQLGVGAGVGVNEISTATQSSIIHSTIQANDDVKLQTTNLPRTHGVGMSAGSGQFGVAGTIGVNTVDFQTESRIVGSRIDTTGDISVTTIDRSEIRSDAGAVSLGLKRAEAGAPPSSTVSGALGVALAVNYVGTTSGSNVGSYVSGSQLTAEGELSITTVSQPRIEALTLAGAVAAAQNPGNQPTGALAGAAAGSYNSIKTYVESSITDSTVQAGNVYVTAVDQSSILADAGGVGIAAALGEGNTAALGIGAGIAINEIGGATRAFIQSSTIYASGNVVVRATVAPPADAKSIDALALAGGASVGVSPASGQAGAFAGAAAITINQIDRNVFATIEHSHVTTTSTGPNTNSGNVIVAAYDQSTINADAGGVAIAAAASASGNSGAASIGASVSLNRIGNGSTTGAVVAQVDDSTIIAAGSVQVTAEEQAVIDSLAIIGAISVGLASSGSGVTAAGAGAGTKNSIRRRIAALITGDSHVDAHDSITVSGQDEPLVRAYSVGLSVSAAVAPTGTSAALAIGASVTLNDIANSIVANVDGSTLTSGGNISVTAVSSQKDLFTLTQSGPLGLTVADLDDLATQASDDSTTNSVNEYDQDKAADVQLRLRLALQFGSHGINLSGRAEVAQLAVGNGWLVADPVSGKTYTILRSSSGDISVQQNNISAVAAAASVSVAVGQNGIALSGGGAGASNVILTTTEATVYDSSVTTTAGNLNVQAINSSGIASTVVAAAIGVGASTGTAGVAAAIGAAYAENFIGFDRDGNRLAAVSLAEVSGGESHINGDLNINAATLQKIGSVVFAGSVAVAASAGSAGVGAAGAGANATNKIAADANAHLADSAHVEAHGLTVSSQDNSVIGALAGAISIAVGVAGGGVGVGVSVGVELARNTIDTQVYSLIDSVDDLNASTVSVTADTTAKIDVVSFAASVAVGAASSVGVGVAGAGAEATNSVLGATRAEIVGSTVHSSGDVNVNATNHAEIDAKVLAIAAGVGAAGTVGIAASVGAAVARNLIGWIPDGSGSIPATYSSSSKVNGLKRDQTVKIASGPRAGEVYRFLGDDLTGRIDLTRMNYNDSSIWLPISLTENAALVWAGITDSSITTNGDLEVTADADQSISSLVLGGSIAVGAAGQAGVSGAIGGSYSSNQISTSVRAFIDGDGTGISSHDISVIVTDSSTIDADAIGIAVSGGFAGTAGVALSVGFAAAENTVANKLSATISDAAHITATGDVLVDAEVLGGNQPGVNTITATAVAASLGVGIAGVAGVGVSGAGAGAKNIILSEADAIIRNSTLTVSGDVDVLASSNAGIDANIASAAVGGGGGGIAGVGNAIGVAVAENRIGLDTRGVQYSSGIRAKIIDSTIDADGKITVDALAQQSIHAGVGAGSMAIAGSAIAGVAVAGAGVQTSNTIRQDVIASIDGAQQSITGSSVRVKALDKSLIDSEAGAAAITVSAALAGASLSIAASTSQNQIDNTVSASIEHLESLKTTAGGVEVFADEQSKIRCAHIPCRCSRQRQLSRIGWCDECNQ